MLPGAEWALPLAVLYAVTAAVVEAHPRWRTHRGTHGTRASLLAAYQVCTVAGNAYLAAVGCAWWSGVDAGATATERLCGDLPHVRGSLLSALVAHLASDMVLYAVLPELREPALVAHHAVTGALAHIALRPEAFAHHYCAFFVGVAELSNVPLGYVELAKLVPAVKAASPRAYKAHRACFTAAFVALRLACWPIVSARFWRDSLHVLLHEHEEGAHCASRPTMLFFLLSNAGLTAMQFAWGAMLCRRLFRARRGKEHRT